MPTIVAFNPFSAHLNFQKEHAVFHHNLNSRMIRLEPKRHFNGTIIHVHWYFTGGVHKFSLSVLLAKGNHKSRPILQRCIKI